MLVDYKSAEELSSHDFPSLPVLGQGVVRRYRAGEVELVFERLPSCAGAEDITYIHYSLAALHEGRLVCVISIESLDLRAMALHLCESVKALQRDYGVHGYITQPPVLRVYGNGECEDLEEVDIELKDEYVLPYMMDFMLDSLDLVDDPVAIT